MTSSTSFLRKPFNLPNIICEELTPSTDEDHSLSKIITTNHLQNNSYSSSLNSSYSTITSSTLTSPSICSPSSYSAMFSPITPMINSNISYADTNAASTANIAEILASSKKLTNLLIQTYQPLLTNIPQSMNLSNHIFFDDSNWTLFNHTFNYSEKIEEDHIKYKADQHLTSVHPLSKYILHQKQTTHKQQIHRR